MRNILNSIKRSMSTTFSSIKKVMKKAAGGTKDFTMKMTGGTKGLALKMADGAKASTMKMARGTKGFMTKSFSRKVDSKTLMAIAFASLGLVMMGVIYWQGTTIKLSRDMNQKMANSLQEMSITTANEAKLLNKKLDVLISQKKLDINGNMTDELQESLGTLIEQKIAAAADNSHEKLDTLLEEKMSATTEKITQTLSKQMHHVAVINHNKSNADVSVDQCIREEVKRQLEREGVLK